MRTNTTERPKSRGWPEAMRRYERATSALELAERSPQVEGDALDRAALAAVEAENALIDLPAPNPAGLRWKLERLLKVEDGSTDPWSAEHVRQTSADIARLLPA